MASSSNPRVRARGSVCAILACVALGSAVVVAQGCKTKSLEERARAAASNDVLRLSVENDAVGPAVGTGVGVGLRNVRSRLETRFAGAASCAYGPTPAGGFRVELTMPLQFDA